MKKAHNFFWQFGGHGIGKGIMFLFYLLLPLFIGLEEYGKFSFALAITSILVQPVVEMGLDMVTAKWVSRGFTDVVGKVFILRVFLSMCSLFLILLISFFLPADKTLLLLFYAYFSLFSFLNIFFSFYRGIEEMKLEGIFILCRNHSF